MKAFPIALLLATAAMAVPPGEEEASVALSRAKEAQARSAQRAAALAVQRDRNAAATATADRRAAVLTRQVREAETALGRAQRAADSAAKAEERQALRVAETRAPLAGMTAALARIARRPPALALANGATVAEAAHLQLLIRHIRAQIAARDAVLTAELARRSLLRERATHALATVQTSRRLLAERRRELATALADLAERGILLADAAETEGQKLRGLAEESAALGSALSDSRRDRALNQWLGGLAGPSLPADAAAPRAVRPTKALYRLPDFGRVLAGTSERDADGVKARGLTLATPQGLLVVAPAAGRIRYAGSFRNYGDIVILDHGRGWTSLVAGLARTTTELGANLAQGAAVGRSGRRLLIELRHDGRPVDIVAMADALAR
ncbi:peptidoglycan DD-metalloendopeptidase family protein [Sphingomonas sp. BIUV-7]|uniref:Peptidoglycan DD-metalloendopeptidase family protein n=1 Tax=Sphingomonas natans TaxID=3063330 RepID=A0ABT8Y6N9_9SPHN|nr:peptidoglycan DD-metalloendopeptidase family protein [Sphingomonas sp. BIUV-7]MDO6413980.1 peptidoglycan DD-metalloendopeptidase family protein [Sphingomonas sp. BIUV-7]